MTDSPTTMSLCRQPQRLVRPTTTGVLSGFNPELIDPDLSLAIENAVRDALGAGISLREVYTQVHDTIVSKGLPPDTVDIERCVKNHALMAI